MTSLINAWNTKNAVTDNGMVTHSTSNNACMDFFSLAGASRGKDITLPFLKALGENDDLAVRSLLWLRDVRGGAGERQQFRNLLKTLVRQSPATVKKILPLIPEVGRWDDILELLDTPVEDEALNLIRSALESGNGLAAKWMPRKGPVSSKIRNNFGWSPKFYRKTLVGLTKVVETQMCANQWDQINYEHVPSVASKNYQKAFNRHDEVRYQAYRNALENGEAKINASAIFPHDVIKSALTAGLVADAQWKALPNYMDGCTERILPVCDVSGSMMSGGGTVRPIDVSISLGLYISERNKGVFKDIVCTFSAEPSLVQLKTKGLKNRVHELNGINWGTNTDLTKTFSVLLKKAVENSVPESEMPTMVLIISDMEFDSCVGMTGMEMIRKKYEDAGYALPKVVFWNVNGRQGNVPVKVHESGTALVSGFSPSVLKGLLSNPKDFTPYQIMLNTIGIDKYKWK